MDNKDKSSPISSFEAFFNRLPCPLFMSVFSSFIFVYLLGLFFSTGVQIYPIFNNIPEDVDCPECHALNDVKASVTERQFRVVYSVNTPLDITKRSAWRLFRIRVYGPLFDQEIRAENNCGVYVLNEKYDTIHFELTQDGPIKVELYCLDKLLLTINSTNAPFNRESKNTIFQTDKEMFNICRKGKDKIFFSKSHIFNILKNGYISDLQHKYQTFDNYSSDVAVVNNGFLINYTYSQILQMTTNQIIKKVLLVSFVQSHFGQTIIFKNNDIESGYTSVLHRITENKAKFDDHLCFKKLTMNPNFHKIQTLSQNEYELMRKLAVTKDKEVKRGESIYITSFDGSKDIQKEDNQILNIEENIENQITAAASAKAMIVKDGPEMLSCIWMPRESPVIIITPPVRTVFSKATEIINATGRRIIFVKGNKDGSESSDKDRNLVDVCLNDEEKANSKECKPVYKEMKYKFDVQKVIEAIKQV